VLAVAQVTVLPLPATSQLPYTVLTSDGTGELVEARKKPATATAVASITPSPIHHGRLSISPAHRRKAVRERADATVHPQQLDDQTPVRERADAAPVITVFPLKSG
jgi:hypothetical protein